MPSFEYLAIDSKGRSKKGTIDAENLRLARQKLREKHIFPTKISESQIVVKHKSQDIGKYFQRESLTTKELCLLTRQLSTLVGAGLPLISALHALTDQTDSQLIKKMIVDIKEAVEGGSSLAKALGAFPKSFPRLYINMVAAGESSGLLDKVLNNLADYLEGQMVLRSKLKKALTYPVLMMCLCVIVIAVLMVFVVPKIVDIFNKKGAILPIPTRIVMWCSENFISFGLIAGIIIFAFVSFIRWYYKTDNGRKKLDMLIIRFPIFGKIYVKVATSRTASTLSALLTSGVQLLTAIEITKKIMANIHYEEGLEQVRIGVAEGKSLASELSKTKLYPSMLYHMIAIGEKSGELENMMSRAGTAYEVEVKNTLDGLSTIIEPLIIIIVGGIVLFIVISVLLPMADLMSVIRQ